MADLNLDAIRRHLDTVRYAGGIGPTLARIVHEDVPALLAKVERLKRQLAEARSICDQAQRLATQRFDESLDARQAVQRTTAERDRALAEVLRLITENDQLRVNQLPDGGVWQTQYSYHGEIWWDERHDPRMGLQRRVGPVEPIEPDDDPTQPAAPRAVANDVARTDPAEGHAPHGPVPEAHAPSEGVAGQDATVRYEFAEPDNNCFIPRSGDWPVSGSKLQQAAGWYGGALVNFPTDEADQS